MQNNLLIILCQPIKLTDCKYVTLQKLMVQNERQGFFSTNVLERAFCTAVHAQLFTHCFLFTHFTLKYTGSTLCWSAWALATSFSTDATLSELSRFSTSVLMAFITLRACFLSWALFSSSSASSMCLNWLKNCLEEGKLTKNLQRRSAKWKIRYIYIRVTAVLFSSSFCLQPHPINPRSLVKLAR